MSTSKTRVEQYQLDYFFQEHLSLPDVKYEMVADGEVSQAYFYDSPEGARVLRINAHNNEGFLKDKYAAEHYAKYGVPVPKIIEIGELESGIFFSVSDRVPGRLLDNFSVDEINTLMPEIIKTLENIHSIPPAGRGYGYIRVDGNGKYNSWREALIASQDAPDDDKLASVDFFEQKLHDELVIACKELLAVCPNERLLIHGDYGFNNALSDGKKITGVIDWQNSMYGDPLFDVAWLDFWKPQQGFAAQFKKYYAAEGQLPVNFDERIHCYMLDIGISSMAFFAKSGQPDKYEFSKKRVAAARA